MKKALAMVPLVLLLLGGAVQSAEEDTLLPTVPYTSGGNARFFPVAKELILPPGGHVAQVLNVFNMERASIQAAAFSTLGDGAVHVRVGFGPPFVGDHDASLELTFTDRTQVTLGRIKPSR